MEDFSSFGKTKAEIVSSFSNLTADWGTTARGKDVEGYEIVELPYLIGITRDEDKSVTTLFEDGFGGEDSPYTITNWNQLQNINNSNILTQGYYFTLLNDLTTSTEGYTTQVKDGDTLANNGKGWNPIRNNSNGFTGNFDGDNHTIYNLTIKRPDSNYIGFFGVLNINSTIKNIGLLNVNIEGEDYVGGLVGKSTGTIINSYVSGTVNGNKNIGGLVGNNYSEYANIKNSYTSKIFC